MSTTTVDVTTTIDRYFAAWNETDPLRRRGLIADAWTSDAGYLDPMLAGEGHAGIDAMVAAVQAQMPDHVFRLLGPVDSHHNVARFSWELLGPDSEPVFAGTDFAIVAPDGRLRSVTGFLDCVPDPQQ